MSMNKTMVVAGIIDRLVDEVDMNLGVKNKALAVFTMLYCIDGNPEIALPINCPKNRMAPNRVLFCVGSENFLLKGKGLSLSKYNEILIEGGFASAPGRKRDIRKLIEEIAIKNKDIMDKNVMKIFQGGEKVLEEVLATMR